MNDIILLSLLLEGPKHGYRLKQEAAVFSSQQKLHNNTVYPLLNRFLQEGWINQREAAGERGQTRLLYELTLAGNHALIEKLARFTEADASSDQAFRLRVGLFDLLDVQTRYRILELRDRYLVRRLERAALIAQAHTVTGWASQSFSFVTSELEREREWIAQLFKLADQPAT